MSRAEKSPPTKEKLLTRQERNLVINLVTGHINRELDSNQHLGRQLIFSPQWPKLAPYVELIGMRAALDDEELPPTHQPHLRRMMALQKKFVPKKSKLFNSQEFLNEIYKDMEDEVRAAQALLEDMEGVKTEWTNPLRDLLSLKTNWQYLAEVEK